VLFYLNYSEFNFYSLKLSVEKRDTYIKKVLIYDTHLFYTDFMLKINVKVKVRIFYRNQKSE